LLLQINLYIYNINIIYIMSKPATTNVINKDVIDNIKEKIAKIPTDDAGKDDRSSWNELEKAFEDVSEIEVEQQVLKDIMALPAYDEALYEERRAEVGVMVNILRGIKRDADEQIDKSAAKIQALARGRRDRKEATNQAAMDIILKGMKTVETIPQKHEVQRVLYENGEKAYLVKIKTEGTAQGGFKKKKSKKQRKNKLKTKGRFKKNRRKSLRRKRRKSLRRKK
tara:strand:- start:1585 stop:2259 length:675 start_codon:yes stop_codon:yes gene_type:complete